MASDIEVTAGLVCDHIRREDNGKLILIGVYGASMVVAQFPANLVLALMLRVKSATAAEAPLEFRIMLNGQILRSGKGRVQVGEASEQWIHVPSIVIEKIQSGGRLDFDVRVGDGDWKTACWLPLSAAKPSDASATQPLS